MGTLNTHQRYTQNQKNANGKAWYKEQMESIDSHTFMSTGLGNISDYKRKKVNYDLFNNIIDLKDFEYVCQPYGSKIGEMPATLVNRDIVSGKIKVLQGMEMKRPFSWRVMAVNEEATSRKEQEESKRLTDYVVEQLMAPIRQRAQIKYAEEMKGGQLTPDEKTKLQQQMQDEISAQTPEQIRRYMLREHQDPSEVLASQILEYLIKKETIPQKFNKGFKHGMLSADEVYYVGIINDEPALRVVNSLMVDYDESPDNEYVHFGDWVKCEYHMTASQIVSQFGDELNDEDIDDLYNRYPFGSYDQLYNGNMDVDFSFAPTTPGQANAIRVVHFEWRGLRKVGFLTYPDPDNPQGTPLMDLVSEEYELNKEAGDIDLKWEWIPEKHEGWKIGSDKYVGMRPVPGQHKDLDNLYYCPLSYIGGSYDSLNSGKTCPMDRMKAYQYFYNILWYRIELMIASDKGKKLIANINMIPKSAGIDVDKWMYFLDSTSIGWMNPAEEGNRGGAGGDIVNSVKEIDLSLATKIDQYIQLAAHIEARCGDSIGIPKQMEGQIGPNDAVTNTKQSLVQSSHILEPYFDMHNNIKQAVLQSLIEVAKVAWSINNPKKLAYILDDMSSAQLTVNQELLDESTYGIFVSNSSQSADAKQMIEQLADRALQNQAIDLSGVIKVIRAEGLQEAEELLEAAEQAKQQQVQQNQMQLQQEQAKEAQAQRDHEKEQWKHDADMIVLKEEERRKTEVVKQTIESMGFDTNKDEDSDGTPDVLEVAKHQVDANIGMRHQALEEVKFGHEVQQDAHQREMDKKDRELKEKEIRVKGAQKKK